MFNDRRALHDRRCGIVGRILPRLSVVDSFFQRAGIDAHSVLIIGCHPQIVAIIKAHVIEIRFAIIIGEDEGIDIFL